MNLSSDLCSKSGWPWRGFNRWTFLYYKHETNLNIKRVHFEEHVFFIFFIIDICTIAHLQCIGQVHAYLYKEYFYFLAIVWSCHCLFEIWYEQFVFEHLFHRATGNWSWGGVWRAPGNRSHSMGHSWRPQPCQQPPAKIRQEQRSVTNSLLFITNI